MAYTVIRFPVPGGGGGTPPPTNGFITPVYITGGNNIGFPNPFDIVDVGALLASQQQLNGTAVPTADKHLTVAAFDAVIPIAYGHVKVPALLANAVTYNGNWHFWCLWSVGEIDAVEALYINDAVPGFGFSQSALGTDPQPMIGSLFLPLSVWYQTKFGGSTTFDQTAPGIAHSDLIAPVGDIDQPPTLNAVLRGKKLYDPRQVYASSLLPATWVYSRNAALVLADFLRSTKYGAGVAVDDASLVAAADACDADGITIDMLVDRKTPLSDWVATLQTAANCQIDRSGNTVKLIPDALRSSVATFNHSAGQILSVEKEAMQRRRDLPTVIEIIYTDATETTWKDASIIIQRDGVADGTTPWRKSTVRMPWIVESGDGLGIASANKAGYLRMNKAWLRQPAFTTNVMDEGLRPVVGDAIALTYPDSGYSSLKFKLSGAQPTQQGWALAGFYDDPNAYVDDAIAPPTVPPGLPPDPFTVPAIRGLSAIEDPLHPRLIASWLPPQIVTLAGIVPYPYVKDYPITFELIGGSPSLADSGHARPRTSPSFESVDLNTGADYLITVWVRNIFGIIGPPTSIVAHVNATVYTAFRYAFQTANLVNMAELFDWHDGHTFWQTEMGDVWNPTFPNPMDTYTNALATYHTPGTSTLTTEVADAAVPFTGDWFSSMVRSDINGAGNEYTELNASVASPLTRHAAPVFLAGTGRFVALSSEATTTGTQRVDALGEVTVTVTR